MKMQVELYGAFRKYAVPDGQAPALVLDVAEGAGIPELRQSLRRELERRHPGFADAQLIEDAAFAAGDQLLGPADRVSCPGVLAVLPPVCGG